MKAKQLVITLTFLLSFGTYASIDMKQEYKEFEASSSRRIEILDAKLTHMKKKMVDLKGETKDEMEDQYEQLVVMKDELKEKLRNASEVSKEKWSDFKIAVTKYANKVEEKIDQAVQ